MKNKILYLLLLSSTFTGLSASRNDFTEKYSVEPELQDILDDHTDELYKRLKKTHHGMKKHGVWKFDWLPGEYYVKYGLARIRGMEKMNKCIEEHDLNLLTTPDKKNFSP